MIIWLWNLIIGNFCTHKWEDVKEVILTYGGEQCGQKFICKCLYCGKYKSFEV